MTLVKHLVVGISGSSCSGKTTLTKLLKTTFPWASVVHQDIYYYPNDPKYHVYLPDVKHFNWDLKSAVNFPRMEKDLQRIISQPITHPPTGSDLSITDEQLLHFPNTSFVQNHRPTETEVKYLISHYSKIPVTFVEGHILFNHQPFYKLCDLRYFLTLDQPELFKRRRLRVYDPPNPPGYLEKYVWPAYQSRLEESRALQNIIYFDAKAVPLFLMYRQIRQQIAVELSNQLKQLSSPLPVPPPKPEVTPREMTG